MDISKRWTSAESAGHRKDALGWKHYLERWQNDNPRFKSMDFAIYREEVDNFLAGAAKAGYKSQKLADGTSIRPGNHYDSEDEYEVQTALVEVVFP
jgi:hypothetical protein